MSATWHDMTITLLTWQSFLSWCSSMSATWHDMTITLLHNMTAILFPDTRHCNMIWHDMTWQSHCYITWQSFFSLTPLISVILSDKHTVNDMTVYHFPSTHLLLLPLQRSTAVQVRSSVQLMPQNQPSGGGLLLCPTAWSPDQHPAAMLADVSQHILGRTEGRGLGFGQLVCTHTGTCLECLSSSDGLSDHSALCTGRRLWSAGPTPVSKLRQGVPGIRRLRSSSLHWTRSGEVSWPLCRWQGSVSVEPDCRFLQVCLFFHFLSVLHEQAPTGGILNSLTLINICHMTWSGNHTSNWQDSIVLSNTLNVTWHVMAITLLNTVHHLRWQ